MGALGAFALCLFALVGAAARTHLQRSDLICVVGSKIK